MTTKILLLITALIAVHIPTSLVPDSMAWEYYSFAKQAETALLSLFVAYLIPYTNLHAKSLFSAWFCTELVDLSLSVFWLFSPDPISGIYFVKALAAAIGFWYIHDRDYDRPNDLLDGKHLFIISKRPNSLQDLILSMLREPDGGVGIYADGRYYHYRKGRLKVDDGEVIRRHGADKYRIRRIRPLDRVRLRILDGLIEGGYAKWTWRYNCKTVLEPIAGKHGKPI